MLSLILCDQSSKYLSECYCNYRIPWRLHVLSRPVSYRIKARNNRMLTDVTPTNSPIAQNHELT